MKPIVLALVALALVALTAGLDEHDDFQLFESTFQEERTDKQSRNPGHSYSFPYSMIFGKRRHTVSALLEVGIGGVGSRFPNNMKWIRSTRIGGSKYIPGASLRSWRHIFPNATIVGVDVDEKAVDWVVLQNLSRVVVRTLNSSRPVGDDEWVGRLGVHDSASSSRALSELCIALPLLLLPWLLTGLCQCQLQCSTSHARTVAADF